MAKTYDHQDDPCSRWQAWLDVASDTRPAAQAAQQLTAALSLEDRAHLQACAECRIALEAWLSFRHSLTVTRPSFSAPPWFASRVMAVIAAREEESRPIAAWLAVPRFASRLAWASAALLFFAGTWLYQKPPARVSKPSVSATESLFDTQSPSVSEDEVLVSLAEQKP
jgi:hypothetical protein